MALFALAAVLVLLHAGKWDFLLVSWGRGGRQVRHVRGRGANAAPNRPTNCHRGSISFF
jgi:hypothetical protein